MAKTTEDVEQLMKYWWYTMTGKDPVEFTKKMGNDIFNTQKHWGERAIGEMPQDYLKRRSRKVRDALNQADPKYPELTKDESVDLSPDENLVVPERAIGADGKPVRRKPGWNPAHHGFALNPAAAGRKRKEMKYDTPPMKTTDSSGIEYKWAPNLPYDNAWSMPAMFVFMFLDNGGVPRT